MDTLWHATRGFIGCRHKYSHYAIWRLINNKHIFFNMVNGLFRLSEQWCCFWSSDKFSFYIYFFQNIGGTGYYYYFFLLSILTKESFCAYVLAPLRASYGTQSSEIFLWVHLTRSLGAWAEIFIVYIYIYLLIWKVQFFVIFHIELTFLYFKFYLWSWFSHISPWN